MTQPVRVLLLEDNEVDAELILHQLATANLDVSAHRVDTEEAFRHSLMTSRVDVILSDNRLPTFDGLAALRLAREVAPEVPFIFVSGSLGEERAVQALREGATDYVLKDRMGRLSSAVARALDARHEQELKQAAQELARATSQRFELAARATSDVIWDWDVSAGRAWFAEGLHRLIGAPVTEGRAVRAASWWCESIHPDDLGPTRSSLDDVIARGAEHWGADYRLLRDDGTTVEVSDRATVLYDADGRATRVVGAMLDLTPRKRADEKFRNLLEAVPDGIVIVESDGRIALVNSRLETMFGFSREELLSMTIDALVPEQAEEIYRAMRSDEATRDVGTMEGVTLHARRRDGTEFPIEVSLSPLAGDDGAMVIASIRDVTDRKLAEQQLEQERRISALGRVAAVIAHEFNNVLMGIGSFVDVIGSKVDGEPTITRAVGHIKSTISRGKRVTSEILSFTRPSELALQVVDLREWLLRFHPELQAIAGADTTLTLDLPEAPLYVACDAVQFQQVVLNLVVNARDAMGGRGAISAQLARSARTLALNLPPGHAGSFVELTVSDHGRGIPHEILDHLFEPLFTTKRTGTGLGLAVARQVVVQHGGIIYAENRAGGGAAFHILLPEHEPERA